MEEKTNQERGGKKNSIKQEKRQVDGREIDSKGRRREIDEVKLKIDKRDKRVRMKRREAKTMAKLMERCGEAQH